VSSQRFPILGSEVPPLVGRQEVMKRLWSDLTKATPSNLSVVGPRRIGKTVCLRALEGQAKQQRTPYPIVAFWELGHAPPTSDDAFIAAMCDVLRLELKATIGPFKDHQAYLEDRTYGSLKEVMDLLDLDEHPVLMIWDGLDKPLGQGLLTGHLFGQLRDLFHGKRHKIVTAARATQSELARNKQVYDSEFWNLFDVNPVRIGPFHEADVAAAIAEAQLTLTSGAAKELGNWTGNFPLLVLAILNRLAESTPGGEIDNEGVNRAAVAELDRLSEFLTSLWETDCTEGARDAYRLLVEHNEVAMAELARDEVTCLTSRGLAVAVGSKLKLGCRLMQRHVERRLPTTGSMTRLFGAWDSFRSEIRGVLELRLKQIPIVSVRLHRVVARSLEDIPEFPNDCLNSLTSIEEQALDFIWEHEFGSLRQIPADITAYWTLPPRDTDKLVARMMSINSWGVPSHRWDQVRLLQLLTGSSNDFESKARHVSKDTYVLVNAIHSFRNRNQHADGQAMHEGVAVAAMITCVELLGCLAREFASP
jgi:hypothetical protein